MSADIAVAIAKAESLAEMRVCSHAAAACAEIRRKSGNFRYGKAVIVGMEFSGGD
jgi:hypothetical protein